MDESMVKVQGILEEVKAILEYIYGWLIDLFGDYFPEAE